MLFFNKFAEMIYSQSVNPYSTRAMGNYIHGVEKIVNLFCYIDVKCHNYVKRMNLTKKLRLAVVITIVNTN